MANEKETMKTRDESEPKSEKERVPFIVAKPVSSDSHASSSHGHGHQPRGHQHGGDHGHTHDVLDHPGKFFDREVVKKRDFKERAFTIGIGGPVGSGKTALVLALCQQLRDEYSLVVVTNDIFTKEDCQFLTKHQALQPTERIRAVETGGCPHAAIREDCSANITALEELCAEWSPQLALVEAGGDNLAANYSRELADYIIYVIDVAGGDKVPRKGGPGITQSDLLVINKTDLAEAVGADLKLMETQALAIRDNGPVILAQVKHMIKVNEIAEHILKSYRICCGVDSEPKIKKQKT